MKNKGEEAREFKELLNEMEDNAKDPDTNSMKLELTEDEQNVKISFFTFMPRDQIQSIEKIIGSDIPLKVDKCVKDLLRA